MCRSYLIFFFLIIRRPPRSTRTDTLFPYTTLFRSDLLEQRLRLRDRHAHDVGVAPAAEVERLAAGLRMGADDGMDRAGAGRDIGHRSEEHTSELQSLMRISYAVFCLKKKKNHLIYITQHAETKTHYKIQSRNR